MLCLPIAVFSSVVCFQAPDPPARESPLAGPAVEEVQTVQPPTLVRRGFNGTVEVLAIEADVAAMELIDLDPEQREIFDRIRMERSALFSKVIRENLDLLMEFSGVDPEARPAEFVELLQRVGAAMREYRERGTMMREMLPHLRPEQMREVRRLVSEYLVARADAIRRETGEEKAAAIAIRIQLETLGEMARASIEGAVAMGSAIFEELAQRLGLTPEQRAKVHRIYEPIGIAELQGKEVAPILKVRAFLEISQLLSPEQIKALAEYAREERRAAEAMDIEADR